MPVKERPEASENEHNSVGYGGQCDVRPKAKNFLVLGEVKKDDEKFLGLSIEGKGWKIGGMKANDSLQIFSRAAVMLAEADTLQKAKELKSLALTAADWARRKGMGEEAILHCRSYALEAERKMGQMLDEADLKAGRPKNGIQRTPLLSELKISKKESSQAQRLAALPVTAFEKLKNGEKTRAEVKREIRAEEIKQERAKIAKAGSVVPVDDRWRVIEADMKQWRMPEKFDFIITDPPYPKEFLPLFSNLGELAAASLKDGGLLVVMCGQSYLDEIYALLRDRLDYYWTGCYWTPGQPTPLRNRNVNTTWKPLLMFVKKGDDYKGRIFGDVFKSDGNDKDFHKWGQSVTGMDSIVRGLCNAGQTILDPFCGAGTTGIAAVKHGCLFTGLEIDAENVNIAKQRISDALIAT